MSRLDELIQEYCPDGLEYRTLGELGHFYGGITGKSKKDFVDGNAVFISYKNVYQNPALDIHPSDRVKISEDENQRTLMLGDIIFTGSSETPDECGFSSVITEQPTEPLYLNSFCFFFRLDNPEILIPDFAKHLFRSDNLRYQIGKTASGVTRFNVSKDKMSKVKIPLPALPVQREIVRILDTFAELAAELASELAARKKQYEYFREKMMTFNSDVDWKRLDEVCDLVTGATPDTKKAEYWDNGNIPWMSSGEVNKKRIYDTDAKITQLGYESASTTLVPAHSVVIALAGQGKTRGKVAMTEIELCTNQSLCSMVCGEHLKPEYLYFYLDGKYEELRSISNGDGTRGGLSLRILKPYRIPVPSIQKQEEIISSLNKFDELNESINNGLPAEIEARQKQYEYYRDKLLTFKELKS